jgi:hypothetical protein
MKKLRNIFNYFKILFRTKVVFIIFALLLILDFLFFKIYGNNYEDQFNIFSILITLLQIYVIAGLNYLLFQNFKKFRFLKSLAIFITSLVVIVFCYFRLEDIVPSWRILLNFLDISALSLVIGLIIFIGFNLFHLKLIKNKRFLIIAAIVVFALISIFNFNIIQAFSRKFYYQTINPTAGISFFERLYKENFNAALDTLNETNALVFKMQQNSKDTNTLYNYQEQIREYYSKREAYFLEMLRIDEEAKKLRVNEDYRTFFDKRIAADQNDFEAFKIYKDGMLKIMDGILSYAKFQNLYGEATRFVFVLTTPDGFTAENINYFTNLSSKLDLQYNEIASLSEKGIFTEELSNYMSKQNEAIKLFKQLNDAYASGDKEKADKIYKKLELNIENVDIDQAELITQWSKEKAKPVFEAQDEKHKKSLDLYNQAYIYAKNQNLNYVLSVWGGQTPGSYTENKEI